MARGRERFVRGGFAHGNLSDGQWLAQPATEDLKRNSYVGMERRGIWLVPSRVAVDVDSREADMNWESSSGYA